MAIVRWHRPPADQLESMPLSRHPKCHSPLHRIDTRRRRPRAAFIWHLDFRSRCADTKTHRDTERGRDLHRYRCGLAREKYRDRHRQQRGHQQQRSARLRQHDCQHARHQQYGGSRYPLGLQPRRRRRQLRCSRCGRPDRESGQPRQRRLSNSTRTLLTDRARRAAARPRR